jgi:hypothetical protein
MARIAMGVGTSHGPLLNTPPLEWDQRARADRRSTELIYRGESYDFAGLRAARGRDFSDECALDVRQRRHAACRAAIDELGRRVRAAGLDVLVVVSSDHKEIFGDELMPQFAFYWGDTVGHEPYTQEQLDALPPGLAIAARQAGLFGELVDYQPCYRSEAGTGCAMCFVTWGGE